MALPKEAPKTILTDTDIEQRLLYLAHGRKDTPFDTFLKYTNQKEEAGRVLADMMASSNGTDLRMLDIGAGEGELHVQILNNIHKSWPYMKLDVTFVEPKDNQRENLKGMIKTAQTFLKGGYQGRVMNEGTWEEAGPQLKGQVFDRILCAHTIYHFPSDTFEQHFNSMADLLSENGRMYVVARQKDEVYKFIKKFFQGSTGRQFNEITIDDARSALEKIALERGFIMQERTSHAQVVLPFDTAPEDARQIVGFYLRKPWEEIPKKVRTKIWNYLIGEKTAPFNRSLNQLDGIIELARK